MLELFQKKSRLMELSVSDVYENPNQPRKTFNEEALKDLSNSILENGLIQPITVRRGYNGKYELIAGERRLRATKMAGIDYIQAIVMDADNYDSAALALIENLQRENLCYLDEAEALSKLIYQFSITQEELAKKIGKNQATIANKIRILRLSDQVKQILRRLDLTERHARALLKLDTEAMQIKALEIIEKRGLNVTQTDKLIADMVSEKEKKEPKGKKIRLFKDIRIFTNTIKQAIDIMKQSGVEATAEKKENDEYIEYVVKISKVYS